MIDLPRLDQRALRIAETIVDRVTIDQLALPTPCSAWNLGRLPAHMTGRNHGFAAAARGEITDASDWADRPVGAELGKVFAASAEAVAVAFAEDGVLDRVRPGPTTPIRAGAASRPMPPDRPRRYRAAGASGRARRPGRVACVRGATGRARLAGTLARRGRR
ncbi:maleylpyruvate isomerase N-terminal domain-containing protein [Embleya sp. NPDC005575]|uniref:maleylpyruvate isomerase N-terminal domain-containing protein n=1 Tax=Embleya sp. NPDC005575 TaxID=3156892 RepID=UPI0033A6A62C